MNRAGENHLVVGCRDLAAQSGDELEEVLRNESLAFRWPYGPEVFQQIRRNPNAGVRVAIRRGELLGHLVYQLREKTKAVQIKSMAVFAGFRRRGVGTQLLEDLRQLAAEAGCREITVQVRETNLAAQLFFRAAGYQAYEVERQAFRGSQEDAFWFRISPLENARPGETLNRIAALGVDLWSGPSG